MSLRDFLMTWGMIVIGVLMNVFGVYAVKARLNELGSIHLGSLGAIAGYFLALIRSPLALAGGVMIMAAPFPYLVAMSRMDLSLAYPLSVALNCLLILPLTVFFLGEALTINKILAMVCVIVSLYLMYK